MTGKVFRLSCGVIAVVLLVHRASAAITTTACTPGTGTTCEDLDLNAECAVGATTCSCKTNYKANQADDACIKILGSTCADAAGCTGVSNVMCDTTCKCKAGYKTAADTMTCAKILGQTCADNAGCTDDANSVCKDTTCQCKDYFKEVANVCAKVLTSTCSQQADCDAVSNSKCSSTCMCDTGYEDSSDMCAMILDTKTCSGSSGNSDCAAALTNTHCTGGKCQCADNFVKQNAVCKAGNEATCSADTDCLDNAECTGDPKKCGCKSTYSYKNSMCKTDSSAQSVVMSMGLFVVSLLVTLQISL